MRERGESFESFGKLEQGFAQLGLEPLADLFGVGAVDVERRGEIGIVRETNAAVLDRLAAVVSDLDLKPREVVVSDHRQAQTKCE